MSSRNYFVMMNYAKAQAKLTSQGVTKNQKYYLFNYNCVNFIYEMFKLTDLTPDQKDVDKYLKSRLVPVAVYTDFASSYYYPLNIHDPQKLLTYNQRLIDYGIARAPR